jgi:hypothetical protein
VFDEGAGLYSWMPIGDGSVTGAILFGGFAAVVEWIGVDLGKVSIKPHKTDNKSKVGILQISDNHLNEIIYEHETLGLGNSFDFVVDGHDSIENIHAKISGFLGENNS